jgi:hypothetical protein
VGAAPVQIPNLAIVGLPPRFRSTANVDRACPKSNDRSLFVAHFFETLCRMSKTAVDDKVGDEVVATNGIDPVVLGQALDRFMGSFHEFDAVELRQ